MVAQRLRRPPVRPNQRSRPIRRTRPQLLLRRPHRHPNHLQRQTPQLQPPPRPPTHPRQITDPICECLLAHI